LRKVVDYREDGTGKYTMPYFYFNFRFVEYDSYYATNRSWSHDEMMKTFSEIWAVKPDWTCGQDDCEATA